MLLPKGRKNFKYVFSYLYCSKNNININIRHLDIRNTNSFTKNVKKSLCKYMQDDSKLEGQTLKGDRAHHKD